MYRELKKYGFQVFDTCDIVVASPKVLVFRAFRKLLDFRQTNHRNEGNKEVLRIKCQSNLNRATLTIAEFSLCSSSNSRK